MRLIACIVSKRYSVVASEVSQYTALEKTKRWMLDDGKEQPGFFEVDVAQVLRYLCSPGPQASKTLGSAQFTALLAAEMLQAVREDAAARGKQAAQAVLTEWTPRVAARLREWVSEQQVPGSTLVTLSAVQRCMQEPVPMGA